MWWKDNVSTYPRCFFHLRIHLFTALLLIPKIPLSDLFVIIDPSLLFISWPVKCLFSSLNPLVPADPGVFLQNVSLWYLRVVFVCACWCPLPVGVSTSSPLPTFTLHPTLLFLKLSYLPRPPIFLLPNPLTPTVPLSCLSLNPPWWSVLLTPAERRRNGVVTAVTRSCQSLSSTLHRQPRSEGSLFIWIQKVWRLKYLSVSCRREISEPPSPCPECMAGQGENVIMPRPDSERQDTACLKLHSVTVRYVRGRKEEDLSSLGKSVHFKPHSSLLPCRYEGTN